MEENLKQTSKGQLPQHESLVEDFMNLAMQHEKAVMNKIQGQFDPIDQEYTILDQLLLATKSIPESKQPPSRQGIVTRSMAKKQ
jgi:hypothetical protein